ncbi:hypothetical protein B0H12DRAFT_1065574, partial [Mycena haematopus]
PDPPAFVRALPYIRSGATLLLSSLFRTVSAAVTLLAHPIVLVLPASIALLLYIVAPLLVFSQLVFETVLHTPYRVIVFLSDAVYPAYVFLGVACITGGLLGWTGRSVVLGVLALIGPQSPPLLVGAYEQKART